MAGGLVGDRRRGKRAIVSSQELVARDRAVDHVAVRHALQQGRQFGGPLGQMLWT